MPVGALVYRRTYQDSVTLVEVARALRRLPGVRDAEVILGTASNRRWLEDAGLLTEAARSATPNDLVIAVHAETDALVDQALAQAEAMLEQRQPDPGEIVTYRPRTLRIATRTLPQADLALISVAGQHATHMAYDALARGYHVFLFSGGISLDQERSLKEHAVRQGRLLMGPAAGAAILNGIALGFASQVPRGDIGLVGTDGTDLQQVATLIAREERHVGISQAFSAGARDLTAEVGGRSTIMAVRALLADEQTHVLVLLGAQPATPVAEEILHLVRERGKPAVVAFLEFDADKVRQIGLTPARTFHEAALLAVGLSRQDPAEAVQQFLELENQGLHSQATALRHRLRAGQRYVRGLYSGHSLAMEALHLLQSMLGPVGSNLLGGENSRLQDIHRSVGHALIDMGTDSFTAGRPHPILDCAQRNRRLLREAEDAEVAIILLDVVLGVGGHPDPAGEMATVIQSARAIANVHGRDLLVLASVCGTRADPQDLWAQEEKLRDAGSIVLPSNAAAAKLAGLIARSS